MRAARSNRSHPAKRIADTSKRAVQEHALEYDPMMKKRCMLRQPETECCNSPDRRQELFVWQLICSIGGGRNGMRV
jgi:hypothetical protein